MVSSVDAEYGLNCARHVGCSRPSVQTHVPCIGRQILNYWTTREAETRSLIQDQSDSKIYLDIRLPLSIAF